MDGIHTTAVILKIIKIAFYLYFTIFFLKKGWARRKKEGVAFQKIIFEFFSAIFFSLMAVGTIFEIVMEEFFLPFYQSGGEAIVYFIGFIGLIFLTYAFERIAKLRIKGVLPLIPAISAILTLIYGIEITKFPYYFFQFIIGVIPFLFFYIAYSFRGEVRKKCLLTGLGFICIFGGEALNYHIIQRELPAIVSLFGGYYEIFPPFIIIVGLITLTQIGNIYVILSVIPDMNVVPRTLLVMVPDGRCIYSYKFEKKDATDEDLIAGFISSISNVIQEITKSTTQLDLISQKDIFIVLEYGNNVIGMLIINRYDKRIRQYLRSFVDEFELKYKAFLSNWHGELSCFLDADKKVIEKVFEPFILKEKFKR